MENQACSPLLIPLPFGSWKNRLLVLFSPSLIFHHLRRKWQKLAVFSRWLSWHEIVSSLPLEDARLTKRDQGGLGLVRGASLDRSWLVSAPSDHPSCHIWPFLYWPWTSYPRNRLCIWAIFFHFLEIFYNSQGRCFMPIQGHHWPRLP